MGTDTAAYLPRFFWMYVFPRRSLAVIPPRIWVVMEIVSQTTVMMGTGQELSRKVEVLSLLRNSVAVHATPIDKVKFTAVRMRGQMVHLDVRVTMLRMVRMKRAQPAAT